MLSQEMARSTRSSTPPDIANLRNFGAKLRAARAILNWSQTELGRRSGLTQRSIHRIESGAVSDVRVATLSAIEEALADAGIKFVALPDGGFTMKVPNRTLKAGGKH